MYNQSGAAAYARVGLESAVMSADHDQLVTMLFDGALSALVRARLFMLENVLPLPRPSILSKMVLNMV